MDRRRSLVRIIGRHFGCFRKSQRTTMTCLAWGLAMGGRLGLASIARGMLDLTTVRHRIKRVDRFASNGRICPQKATACLVSWLMCAIGRRVVVALDWTDIGRRRVMLVAAVAIGRRAVPIAWTVMGRSQFTRKRKSRNEAEEQMILLLKEAFDAYPWVLVADRGFARARLFARLKAWGIDFGIRASGTPWVEGQGWAGAIGNLPRQPGRSRLWRQLLYHKSLCVPVNLVLTHAEPAPEPWYLVTNLGKAAQAIKAYRQRVWIEQHIRDAKTHMGLDRLRVGRARRIERLLVLMAIVTAFAVLTALTWMNRHPQEDLQLTSHKRGWNLSVFRLGLELLRAYGPPSALARPCVLALVEAL